MNQDDLRAEIQLMSIHPHSRICRGGEEPIHVLTRNADVPHELIFSALQLFGDSIIAYHGSKEREGQIRFYPSVLLTAWSGFETFVRYTSELMLLTVREVPEAVGNFLRDRETYVDRRGEVCSRPRHQNVLDRYVALLRYGYGLRVDRGNRYWQRLDQAKEPRNYYTHLDVNDPRSITAAQVLEFAEAILLGIIWPSCGIGRTLLLGIFKLYDTWVRLKSVAEDYTERPFLKDFPVHKGYLFHCNFDNVDTRRFPNTKEEIEARGQAN